MQPLQRLVVGTGISNPSIPQRNHCIRRDPHTRISNRTNNVGTNERHTPLDSTGEQECVQNKRLLDQCPSPLAEIEEVVFKRLGQGRGCGIELVSRCLGTGALGCE